MTGKSATEVTGRGTGLDDKQLSNKIKIINEAICLEQAGGRKIDGSTSKVGGF